MRFPLMFRSLHDTIVAGLNRMILAEREVLAKDRAIHAQELEQAKKREDALKADLERLKKVNQDLRVTNHGASKILGVLANRSVVRFLVADLKGEAPVITLRQETESRKPTLRLVARYPSDRQGIGSDESVVVDPNNQPKDR